MTTSFQMRPPLAAGDPRDSIAPELLAEAQQTAYPVVANQYARRDRSGLISAAGVAMLLGGVTFFSLSGHRNQTAVPTMTAVATPTAVSPVEPPIAVSPPVMVGALPATPPLGALPGLGGNRYGATTLVYDSMGGATGAVAAPAGPAAGSAVPAANPGAPAGMPVNTKEGVLFAQPGRPHTASPGLNPDETFAQQLDGTGDNEAAKPMATPAATIVQGTLMPAVLETAIDTDVPGFVRAVISRDIRSFDGSRVLVPRSSHVIGQYKSAPAQGQSRVYVLWTRLIRPDGVSIDLGSPTADSSGRNGLGGQVNSHFGKRFGAAILLSAIGAAGQAIGGGGNTAVILSGPQNSMQGATQGNANIPPTIRVAQGQPILIFTAHDLDFSSVAP